MFNCVKQKIAALWSGIKGLFVKNNQKSATIEMPVLLDPMFIKVSKPKTLEMLLKLMDEADRNDNYGGYALWKEVHKLFPVTADGGWGIGMAPGGPTSGILIIQNNDLYGFARYKKVDTIINELGGRAKFKEYVDKLPVH